MERGKARFSVDPECHEAVRDVAASFPKTACRMLRSQGHLGLGGTLFDNLELT